MPQGCTNHPWNPHPNCLACQVKDMHRSQAYSAALTEEQVALSAEANYHAANAAAEAAAAAESQRRLERNAANYHLSLWRQSAEGQQWEEWSRRAEAWVYAAEQPDDVLDVWKHVAAPGWDDPKSDLRKKGAADAELGCGIGTAGVLFCLGFGASVIRKHVAHGLFTWVMWLSWGALALGIVAVFLWRAEEPEPRELGAKEANANGFTDRYANPFEKPSDLPSWRAGLTRADNAAEIAEVRGYLDLDGSYFPRPSELPNLPELIARSRDELPTPVADAMATRQAR